MAERFEFFEHTADIGACIHGAALSELFKNAAAAMYEALGTLRKTRVSSQKSIEIEAETPEDLLHDWLAELLFEVEANHLLYDELEIRELTPQRLTAAVRGGPIDFARSQTNQEIKAVTYHQLRVEELPDGTWRATVIFDV